MGNSRLDVDIVLDGERRPRSGVIFGTGKKKSPPISAGCRVLMSEPSRALGLPTASTVTAAAATTTATAVGLGASFVHIERSGIKFCSVECLDSSTCCIIGHRHETKATGTASVAVGDHNNFFDFAVSCERIAKDIFAGIKI